MKILIKLTDTKESKELFEQITNTKFENLTIHLDPKNLELTIRGDFYITSGTHISGKQKLCIEDEEYVYLMIDNKLIRRYIIKDIK